MPWEMWPEVNLKYFINQKNIFWGSRKLIWGLKRPNFCKILAKFDHL